VASWHLTDSSPVNHHAIIVDVNLVDCISKPCCMVVWPQNSALPYTRKKYLHALQDHTSHHKLAQKLDQLFLLSSSPTTSKQSLLHALELFNRVKTKGMKHTKHLCHHLNMGALQFSPELNLWHECHLLLQLVLKCHSGHCVKACYIHQLAHSCNISNPLSFSALQAREEYQAANLIC